MACGSAQADLNWQMTGFFLLALLLLAFVMKLVALLLPLTVSYDRSLWFWLHLSPNSLQRLRPVGEPGLKVGGGDATSPRLLRTGLACRSGRMKPRLFAVVIVPFALSLLVATRAGLAADSTAKKPVLLYSRCYNAVGESRYLPDGTYQEILARLRDEFEVRVHRQPLNARTLAGVNLVLIANPSDKAVGTNPPPPHVTGADIGALTRYVEQGGGLIVMGNQENHNLEIMDLNQLLVRFGLQFTNRYTDVKKLVLPRETPVIGGLRWGYYTGNLLLITPDHSAKPRPLILNDLAQKPINGPRDTPGALLAVAEPGRGHVVVVTDAGWISNDALSDKGIGGVSVNGQDNAEIFRRLAHSAAGTNANRQIH